LIPGSLNVPHIGRDNFKRLFKTQMSVYNALKHPLHCHCRCRVRIRFNVTNSLFEDMFAKFENTEGGQEDTDDDASHHVRCSFSLYLYGIFQEYFSVTTVHSW